MGHLLMDHVGMNRHDDATTATFQRI
jgi:hypothetical protein